MIKKIVIIVLVLGIIVGAICWFAPQSSIGKMVIGTMMSFGPDHRDASKEQGIVVTAPVLSKEYTADEKAADTKYLNKAIEVTGTINEVEKNQDGGLMVVLQTEDPAAGVQCTMREKTATATKGQTTTINGFCSGNGITGVSLTDCVIK